jgi:ferrochelatase
MKTGILLVNLGTPDSPSVADVRKYLREFLMDGRVIDVPYLLRFALVNGIIAPFRAPKSAKVYKTVWLKEGSPLKVYGMSLSKKVQEYLGPDYVVRLGMRYQSPSIEEGLRAIKDAEPARIVVVPLFPQYASATNGSVVEEVNRIVSGWQTIPAIAVTGPFFDQDFFLQPIVNQLKAALSDNAYDQILFTYHGLPERQIKKGDHTGRCIVNPDCCKVLGAHNYLCYRAQCFATTRLLAEKAGIPEQMVTTSFQSRLGRDPWIKPYTDEVISAWPAKGIKKVLALSPSFVADCLETTEEIGEEYKEVFEKAGGQHWDLLPCLNDSDEWVRNLGEWLKGRVI